MTTTIGKAEAIALLEQAVAERGVGYVYDTARMKEVKDELDIDPFSGPACLYWHLTEPGCIAGLALAKAGVSDEVLADMDQAALRGETGGTSISMMTGWLSNRADVDITEDGRAILNAAQAAQDNGETWGFALDHATSLL